ncbi:15617_t:CDS:2 [Funneliformis geosporum]|uniref:10844_t:CDS:1 n=1 Tax=Funneliformis geosporum TaxID=1117311 RepID=A0A9W4WZ76_9GLOM|nr:15617_t:CDS:2 [Funneliformis geosporum]CAI2190247.1 10844_t:CDS:2 [Funneliformis geosporum]
MDSYCRPEGGGTNIFPELITDRAGSRYLKMTVQPHSAGSSSCPGESGGYCTKGHVGMKESYGMTANDDNSGIYAFQDRNKIGIQQFGSVTIDRTIEEPEGLPSSNVLPATGITPASVPSTPFNPNQFPTSGNLTPTPTGSGEAEINVPDVDVSPDPDFDPSLDPDGTDPEIDSTQDPDKPTDPEIDPGYDPYDQDND